MKTYNLTDEQKRILRDIVEAYIKLPQIEFYLPAGSFEIHQQDNIISSGSTAADLYALDDENLIKRWKREDGGHHFKPTQLGIEAVSNNFFKPVSSDTNILFEPPAILESLKRFRLEHPDPLKVGFIMMKFERTPAHELIIQSVRKTLSKYGMIALRADDKDYHDDLYYNIVTYMHGCGFGIAIFDRLQSDEFNPNVSLEVGYMLALRKPICLLKDQTLKLLHTDLVGKLYYPFDPQIPLKTIPDMLYGWMKNRGFLD